MALAAILPRYFLDLRKRKAASHPIAGAHNIWELVLHIASDYELVLRRLAGDGRPYTAAEDWPACPVATEENWQRAVQKLRQLKRTEWRHMSIAFVRQWIRAKATDRKLMAMNIPM